MSKIDTVCVYCGSGPGTNPAFMEAARRLGRILAENRIGLVYGGGSAGLVGAWARAGLRHCGPGTRILPEILPRPRHLLVPPQERRKTNRPPRGQPAPFER